MTGDLLGALVGAIPRTLSLAVSALLVGLVLGPALCAACLSRAALLRGAGTLVILAVRLVPPVLWLLLAFYGLGEGQYGIGAFAAATLGLGLAAGARLADVCRHALSSVQAGQWEAAAALHLPRRTLALDVIGPQLLHLAWPACVAQAAMLLRDSAMASLLGIGDVAFAARQASREAPPGLLAFVAAAALYMVLELPLSAAARKADRHLAASRVP